MPVAVSLYTMKLLALAETVHRWIGTLTGLERAHRTRVADYAEAIAATLARTAAALDVLDRTPDDATARTTAVTDLGRIVGYVETMVAVLEPHLDGRKIAGIRRRLIALDAARLAADVVAPVARRAATAPGSRPCRRAARLLAAEGYFRAFADGLRA
jgi:hypothetical protein